MKSWRVSYLEEPEAWQTQILRMLTGTSARVVPVSPDVRALQQQLTTVQPLMRLFQRRGVQAACLECTAFKSGELRSGAQ
jgi:hypothetical protein